MQENIYSLEELKKLKKEIVIVIGVMMLKQKFRPALQASIQDKMMESLVEHSGEVDVLMEIAEISNHFARYGYSDEIKENALDMLGLIRDSGVVNEHVAFQNVLFLMLKNLAEPKDFEINDYHRLVQKEIRIFLNSSQKKIREKVTLYYLDTKSNKYNNILNLSDEFKEDKDFLLILLKNIVELLLDGPKKYSSLDSNEKLITSEDIFVKLQNQYAHGKLGMELDETFFEVKDAVLDSFVKFAFLDLSKYKEDPIKIKYFEHMQMSGAKFLIKYAVIIEKRLFSLVEEKDRSGDADLLVTLVNRAGYLIGILEEIKLEKIQKQIDKAVAALTSIKTKID
jgi:hypothetical protein